MLPSTNPQLSAISPLYHYLGGSGSGPVILPNKHMKVGFAFKAIACGSNAEFYALQTEFLALTVSETIQKDANSNDTIWSANVSWPDGTSLSASDDMKCGRWTGGREAIG